MVIAGFSTLLAACSGQTGNTPSGAKPAKGGTLPAAPVTPVTYDDPSGLSGVTVTAEFSKCPSGDIPHRTDRSLVVDPNVSDVVYVGVEGKGLYKTDNGGTTWRRAISGFKAHYDLSSSSFCFDRFSSASIDARDSQHLCVGVLGSDNNIASANGIYCSRDAGATWQQMNTADMNTAVTAVGIDSRLPNVIYAGVDGNVGTDGRPYNQVGVLYVTTTDGGSWYEADFGAGFVPGMKISDIVLPQAGAHRLFASAPVEVHAPYSEDIDPNQQQFGVAEYQDGAAWTFLTAGMASGPGRRITHLVGAPRNGDRLLAVDGAAAGSGAPHFYFSKDGGQSFQAPSQPPQGTDLDLFAYDPSSVIGDHVFGLSSKSSELFESTDGGDTWASLGPVLPADSTGADVIYSSLVWTSQPNVLYVSGSRASVYRSDDGGKSFHQVLSEASLQTATN
jgi:photosystem II stability/assembly factor-like uncharacterized protein